MRALRPRTACSPPLARAACAPIRGAAGSTRRRMTTPCSSSPPFDWVSVYWIYFQYGRTDRATKRDPAPRARADRGVGLSADARRDRGADGLSLGERGRAAPARAGEEGGARHFLGRLAR